MQMRLWNGVYELHASMADPSDCGSSAEDDLGCVLALTLMFTAVHLAFTSTTVAMNDKGC